MQDLISEARRQVPEMHPVEVKDLLDGGEGCYLIDVRDAEELASGKIPGAVHVSRGTLEMRIDRLIPARESRIILYCAGGVRSLFAAQRLHELGYENVTSMIGGISAWQQNGLPCE